MFRAASAALLVLCLSLLSAPVLAQSVQAYAPENLRQLSVPDRVRVIEREYADQSRGRAIPDDQLEFYLDQIDSGWGFNRIRQDIATSLRGGGRPGQDWPGAGPGGQTLICSSDDRRRRDCRTPFNGRPVLIENISGTRCIEGQNFGGGGGAMWVEGGCRGRFAEGRGGGWGGGGWGGGNGQVVRCESRDRRLSECRTGFRGRAELARQLSGSACVEGRTWGQRGDSVWVDQGCRAEFVEGRGRPGHGGIGNSGYTVTCNSDDNRRRSCAWDRRQGRPVVIENLSRTRCEEGGNWNWDGNAIWVDRGCRARFGSR